MKLKNNYLFAYYLSRLYENRLYDNRMNSALKYYDFSEYIIGLNVDFETLDWSTLKKVKTNRELYNIYGEKMHRVTNEFLNKGYIKEITDIEDIDEVLKLERRHFGALAGQGLVSIALKDYEKAIKSYKEVEKIYPNMKSPKIMIPQIKELIKSKSI